MSEYKTQDNLSVTTTIYTVLTIHLQFLYTLNTFIVQKLHNIT